MRILQALIATGLAGLGAAPAQDQDVVALLRVQLDAQNEQMRQMNARIQALEQLVARVAGSTPAVAAAAPVLPEAEPRPSQNPAAAPDPPVRLHLSGYADFTTVYRSAFTASGIATAFGSIPLKQAPEAQLGEFRGAANHSRISLQLNTRLAGRDLEAYAEMDFLGNAQPNVFAGSNSHTFRLRQYWAQFRGTRWELLGGQTWTLLTLNRNGISPISPEIMHTQLPDPNYSVGLVWTRQGTIRVVRHWKRLHIAAALENPEQEILDPTEVSPDVRGLATRSNPGSNIRPDSLFKVAYDTSVAHLETTFIGRSFQTYSIANDHRSRRLGYGLAFGGVIHAGRQIDLVSQNFASAGGGRYAQGLVPDVVVRPDGQIARVTTFSTLQGVEAKLTRQLLAYGYYGLVYGKRAVYRTPSGSLIGFGVFHGSPLENRTVSQTSVGFRHTVWRQENYGALSYSLNYSYLIRKLWEAAPAGDQGHAHMVYTSFRYNLP